jgi:tRNA-dihydrouridine synthase B
MFDECIIRGRRFAPARFCAPLVGYTHSAFRRLLAELGGCGAVWTEMLSARQILAENFKDSPWVRRRPEETCLVYQLMVNSEDPIEPILGQLEAVGADALDLNLACNARSVRSCLAGSALFEDVNSLRVVLQRVRKHWPHVLTVKIRLGRQRPEWQPRFVERLRVLEDAGVDAVILHPRFFEERFKRRARHELYPWAASLTRLPLIANGDLTGPDSVRQTGDAFHSVSAIMLGRIAVACPWIFATWDQPANVDRAAIWDRMFNYIAEDFPPSLALRRLQMFTKYFAANFQFGHQFNVDLARASSLEDLRERAQAFFSRGPAIMTRPTVTGIG